MTCPIPNCKTEIGSGLILCMEHWQKLPHDLKQDLLWAHPDVAARRKTKMKANTYDELLKVAVGHLSLAQTKSR